MREIPMFANQFRLRRLQAFNWGTFTGLHDIPVAQRGYLFIGMSGSGKSTLLDGVAALITPPRWVDFNAAARDATQRRDRSVMTYLRGAWAEQEDAGSREIALSYLRPGTTWSALAGTFTSATTGQTVVLAQLFWVRGNGNGAADVKRAYLVLERPLALQEFEVFARDNFDLRKLKQKFPDAFIYDEFSTYAERFRRLLGIDSEMALKLLHKTQSAKNLGDLNLFLREFMLDRPNTFDAAQRLVDEFAELQAAHQAVVTARQQVETLGPARDAEQKMQRAQIDRTAVQELAAGLDTYEMRLRCQLLAARVADLRTEVDAKASEEAHQKQTHHNAAALLEDLRLRHQQAGGAQLQQWEQERLVKEGLREKALRKHDQAAMACKGLGWVLAKTPHEFASATGQARQEIEDVHTVHEDERSQQHQLVVQKDHVSQRMLEVRGELEALRRQPSNIPAKMLEMRQALAHALGWNEAALPFVGELVEVRSEEADWRGAIERVLHGFALSILVAERDYVAFSNHINAHNLGGRLVYYRVPKHVDGMGPSRSVQTLPAKLKIKAGENSAWLHSELRARFDYECVTNLQDFRRIDKAVTREGQIRVKGRHEKDDRRSIDDGRHWVLGFNNQAKLALFEQEVQDLAEQFSALQAKLQRLGQRELQRHQRVMHCQTLVNLQWDEINSQPYVDRIAEIERQIRAERAGNQALHELATLVTTQQKVEAQAQQALMHLGSELIAAKRDLDQYLRKLTQTQEDVDSAPALTPHQHTGLQERCMRSGHAPTLNNIDRRIREVVQLLDTEVHAFDANIQHLTHAIESKFAEFKRRWPAEAADLDARIASGPDFMAKLKRLELDGLPSHEARFFDLLQKQSQQNLVALSTYLDHGYKDICERMEMVNESLALANFNQGTTLRVEVSNRQLSEVREFKQDIREAMQNAWNSDNQGNAEQRFLVIKRLVERLASSAPEEQRWRHAVLDVRQHVEFIGRELDQQGHVVEVYRGSTGKSGGQKQKLATTCLAAALAYQLGGQERGIPTFAPVLLDEAFDKADHEFTALAMNIFAKFGFQMIIATPLKSVMTLEPFIGGACFVDIEDRRDSRVMLIAYDEGAKRLNLPEGAHAADQPQVS